MLQTPGGCEQQDYPQDQKKAHRSGDYAYARSRAKFPKRGRKHVERGYPIAIHFAEVIAERRRNEEPDLLARSSPRLLRLEAEQKHPEFATLAERWRRETQFSSSSEDRVLHNAYQSIIAMGVSAVPLVLKELQSRRGHWFWALHFMTGCVDPVPEGANVDAARDAWLTWGRQEGYLE
jgi:hypothetical protein